MKVEMRFLVVVLWLMTASTATLANSCSSVLNVSDFDQMLGWDMSTCQLHKYGYEDTTQCLDFMSESSRDPSRIRFIFYGDSRIRQIGENFVKVKFK